MAFIDKSHEERRQMDALFKEKDKEKNLRDEKLRNLDNQIIEIQSEIEKKRERLTNLDIY